MERDAHRDARRHGWVRCCLRMLGPKQGCAGSAKWLSVLLGFHGTRESGSLAVRSCVLRYRGSSY